MRFFFNYETQIQNEQRHLLRNNKDATKSDMEEDSTILEIVTMMLVTIVAALCTWKCVPTIIFIGRFKRRLPFLPFA